MGAKLLRLSRVGVPLVRAGDRWTARWCVSDHARAEGTGETGSERRFYQVYQYRVWQSWSVMSHNRRDSQMRRTILLLIVAIVAAGVGSADIYRVKNRNDSGTDSLRWAITQANNHAGRDKIVFQPHMAGKVIQPLTFLPPITDNRTIITGDIDGDGTPDVAINGKNQNSGDGIAIVGANECAILCLTVCNSPRHGVLLQNSSYGRVQGCHLGVNLAGITAVYNGRSWSGAADLALENSHHYVIGST